MKRILLNNRRQGFVTSIRNNFLFVRQIIGKTPVSILVALASFCLALVLPQGVGIRFSNGLPHVDLPRLFIVLTVIMGFVFSLRGRFVPFWKSAPVSVTALMFMIVWMLFACLFSQAPMSSVLFIARILMVGPVYALAFGIIASDYRFRKGTCIVMFTTLLILVVIANIEFFTQHYIVPARIRTCFYNVEPFGWILRVALKRGNSLLALGPYVWNHTYGGMICGLSGFAFWFIERRRIAGVLFATLYFVAIMAIGMRAAYIAAFVALTVWLVCRWQMRYLSRVLIALVAAMLLVVIQTGSLSMVCYSADIIASAAESSGPSATYDAEAVSHVAQVIMPGRLGNMFSQLLSISGTLGVRTAGFLQNVVEVRNWFFVGYGPGAFFAPAKVPSVAIQYNDPGLFFAFIFESGFLMVLILAIPIIYVLKRGYQSRDPYILATTSGVLAWSVFSISSWAVWPMLPSMVMLILTERWRNAREASQGKVAPDAVNDRSYSGSDLCIVIPTKDRPDKVESLLRSISLQSEKPGQVVIVASGMDIENTVNKWSAELPILYRHTEEGGQIHQRNMATSISDSSLPLVASFDDDIVLENNALTEMMRFWSTTGRDTAGVAFNIVNAPRHRFSRLLSLVFMSSQEQGKVLKSGYNVAGSPVEHDIKADWLCGGATVWKRDVLSKHSHDAVKSKWAICEDLIFSYPIGKTAPLYVCAAAKVKHEHVQDHVATEREYYYGRTSTLWRFSFEERWGEISRTAFIWMTCGQISARFFVGLLGFRRHHIAYARGQVSGLSEGIKALIAGRSVDELLEE